MQAFIDFLVNNYTWFIIIALILIFALIGYLVDTSEKTPKANLENTREENNQINQSDGVLNMDTGVNESKELPKDVIVMPKKVETPSPIVNQINQEEPKKEEQTEVLDI